MVWIYREKQEAAVVAKRRIKLLKFNIMQGPTNTFGSRSRTVTKSICRAPGEAGPVSCAGNGRTGDTGRSFVGSVGGLVGVC
jgi:hypothetical protein